MSRGPEGGTFNPLHRIVGAVVLVALAVIFLPMLVRPRPAVTTGTSVLPVVPALVRPATPPALMASTSPAPVPLTAATVAVPKAPGSPSVPVTMAPPMPRVRPALTPVVPKKKIVPVRYRGWFVQIASFSQLRPAKVLAGGFSRRGFVAHVVEEHHGRHRFYRVRVGPYRRRQQAVSAEHRLHRWWHQRVLLVSPGG